MYLVHTTIVTQYPYCSGNRLILHVCFHVNVTCPVHMYPYCSIVIPFPYGASTIVQRVTCYLCVCVLVYEHVLCTCVINNHRCTTTPTQFHPFFPPWLSPIPSLNLHNIEISCRPARPRPPFYTSQRPCGNRLDCLNHMHVS